MSGGVRPVSYHFYIYVFHLINLLYLYVKYLKVLCMENIIFALGLFDPGYGLGEE